MLIAHVWSPPAARETIVGWFEPALPVGERKLIAEDGGDFLQKETLVTPDKVLQSSAEPSVVVVLPTPSCPPLPEPQHLTLKSEDNAQV